MNKLGILLAIIVMSCQNIYAQARSKTELDSEKITKAEFEAVKGNSSIKLVDYKNKVVILFLWEWWCGPCRIPAKEINEINKEFANRGLLVIGLSGEESKPEMKDLLKTVKELKLNYKLGWISKNKKRALVGSRNFVPQIYVIDEGVMIEEFILWKERETAVKLRDTIQKALVNSPPKQMSF